MLKRICFLVAFKSNRIVIRIKYANNHYSICDCSRKAMEMNSNGPIALMCISTRRFRYLRFCISLRNGLNSRIFKKTICM